MRNLKILMSFILCMNLFAADVGPGKTFIYKGVKNEVNYKLQKKIVETRYRTETVPDTCTRQIPYQENVCEQETRYRQVCNTIPGEEVCRDVPDQICHDETSTRQVCRNLPDTQECRPGPTQRRCRTLPGEEVCRPGRDRQECSRTADRQECSRGSSTRQCRTSPSRQECSTGAGSEVCENKPGQRVCRTVNGREVCRERPGRRVCRKVPGQRTCRTVPGREICRDVPGERTCRTIPGERQCRTVPGDPICRTKPGREVCRDVPGPDICRSVPGRRVCRDVTETNTVCRDITRNECEWIPEHQECHQVPYEETVCRDVTRYRTETYACTRDIQVPYDVVTDIFNADIDFKITNSLFEPPIDPTKDIIEFTTVLTDEGKVSLNAKNMTEEKILILAKRKVEELPKPETDSDSSVDTGETLENDETPPNESFHKWAFKILLGDPEKMLSVINQDIGEMAIFASDKVMTIEIGKVSNPKYFSLALKIQSKGKTTFEKEIPFTDLVLEETDQGNTIKLDLSSDWTGKLKKKKKYDVSLAIKATLPGKVLNSDMPKLELEHSATVKASK